MLITTIVISILSVIGSLLPLWQNDHWVVRGQMNFRQVYFLLNLLCIVSFYYLGYFTPLSLTLIGFLIISIVLCFKSIWKYSVLAPIEVSKVSLLQPHNQIKIYVYNVQQDNDQYELLRNSIKKYAPDIILLLETDEKWYRSLKGIKSEYSFGIQNIKDDTYGLMLMSRIPLTDARINYLISPEIPSCEVQLNLDGNIIRILGIHPKPPIPGENIRSTEKDLEILAAGSYLTTLPRDQAHILIGDFNEVAWSRTSQEFRKMTGMKDPRIGRGTFATFPSYSPIKFPLDHVYCSPNFELLEYSILDSMGSDHHALFIHFQLTQHEF